jgi:general secretion pathway protein G
MTWPSSVPSAFRFNRFHPEEIQVMQTDKRTNRLSRGFTLIELLVVLAIIGLLAGLVGPQVMKHLGESKTKAAKLQIEELASALDMYRIDVGRYPSSDEGLDALIEAPSSARTWNGPYLRKKKVPTDPWNNLFHYTAPGEHGKFDLFTLGADNAEGGTGEDQDVVSWE